MCPSLSLCNKFYNMLSFYGKELAPLPTANLKIHSLLANLQQLNQHTCSYPPHLEAVSATDNLSTWHVMLKGIYLSQIAYM